MLETLKRWLAKRRAPMGVGAMAAPVWRMTAEDVVVLRQSQGLPMGVARDRLELVRRHGGEQLAATLAAAEALMSHRFTLLGATRYEPFDAERGANAAGYRHIDWHLDPISGLRFPTDFFHSEWNMGTMRPGLADIKLPWELARCQHWPVLAQAWLLSGDEKYAQEIALQMRDFVQSNPVGRGVNWVCTMDVALRAANWALALQWLRDWDLADSTFWPFACERLLEHGHFIRNNLEDKYEVTSNHFLSNVVGLLYVAAVFAERPQGKAWLDWCEAMLEREIKVQVLNDGADFESSIPYHRLVTELFLGAFAVCRHLGRSLSPAFEARLSSMVSYLLGVLRPDGLMPQVGDADDGRLHILSGYGSVPPQDPRHLFGPAAALLKQPHCAQHAGPVGWWETFWWGGDPDALPLASMPPPPGVFAFPDAGHYVSRRDGHLLLVTNARVGTEGFGNHKHNDQLAFELHVGGIPLIVDAGSHVYTGNPASRNTYRSTAQHNTLTVDGVEQNEVNPEWLFRMFEKAEAQTLGFAFEDGVTRYHGSHRGYERLPAPLRHERRFEHRLSDGALFVTDELMGTGEHELHWHFHLAPGVSALSESGSTGVTLMVDGRGYLLTVAPPLAPVIGCGGYSPSYGVEQACQVVDFRCRTTVAGSASWRFSIEPALTAQGAV